MSHLNIVPPTDPCPKQSVIERIKKMPNINGVIQCKRCGSRTIMNTVNGAAMMNGRKTGGTKIDVDVCYDCHKAGIFSPMIPEMKRKK